MRNSRVWWIILSSMVVIDIYVFFVLRSLLTNISNKSRLIIFTTYWLLSLSAILLLVLFPYISYFEKHVHVRGFVFTIVVGLFVAKLFAAIFFLIDDIRRGVIWGVTKISPAGSNRPVEDTTIKRSAFLTWLGIGVGGSLFGTMLYGITNRYNYKIKRVPLSFPNLPSAFKGLKIAQISDIHSGSFNDPKAVMHGVQMVLDQKPDLILFTGDLVNNLATEMHDYVDIFSQLKAPMGVYSILGNHDYADYVEWDSDEAKAKNLQDLKDIHAKMGWRLLLNEHVALEKDGQQIGLLGVENWSASRAFTRYGDMKKTYAGADKYPFKILMSHDPTHWDAVIRPQYPDIDLTLSGHTHGMQFGVDNPYFKWSPVQWVYKQWGGLYTQGKQKIYVNTGFGFIGLYVRVGILPEITMITLT